MNRFTFSLMAATLLIASTGRAASLRCGIGSDLEKLEYVRVANFKHRDKQVTLRFEDTNSYGIQYYQAKIYLDYRLEGDTDKDVVELILAPQSGLTAISSQKVSTLGGGEAFTLYLVKSATRYIQLLCAIEASPLKKMELTDFPSAP